MALQQRCGNNNLGLVAVFIVLMVVSSPDLMLITTSHAARLAKIDPPMCPQCMCCSSPPPGFCCDCCSNSQLPP
ncbi:hypothetical protein IC575_003096 [Cucumis melo]|uniref:Transmembrane protein n=1 Tax=Cucumis melo TaxID=3656 RepID=A0A9I9E622_CUCME